MLSQGTGGRPERIALLSAAALLVVAMVFGGGSRGAGDLMVHLFALPVLGIGILRWRQVNATKLERAFFYVLLSAVGMVALQILPLPPQLIEHLPQRAAVLRDLDSANVSSTWLPLTLDRWGTVRALLSLMTFLACWMVATTLTARARELILRSVLAVAFTLALLGFAQAASGMHSSLRPYDYHHPIGAIGSFASRNHFADLMAMLLPFALCMGRSFWSRGRAGAGAFVWFGLTVVFFLAAALSYSRAGFALACAVVVAVLMLQPREAGKHHVLVMRFGVPLFIAGIGVLAVAYYAWGGIIRRLDQDPLNDLRWQYLANGLDAALSYLPWGSGFGSFRDAYAPFEPVTEMGRTFALHAHNEALEIAVEAGLPGLVLLALGVGIIGIGAFTTLSRRDDLAPFSCAAAIAAFVPLIHSVVDYPLRTLAIAANLGLIVAILLRPSESMNNALGRAS